MEKLISMTDFVLENAFTNEIVKYFRSVLIKHCKYAEFLKQPLTLGMFVPCDLDGNVLQEPDLSDHYFYNSGFLNNDKFNLCKKQFEDAKLRVLFEGFYSSGEKHAQKGILFIGIGFRYGIYQTIEDLLNRSDFDKKEEIMLTPTALKQIGL